MVQMVHRLHCGRASCKHVVQTIAWYVCWCSAWSSNSYCLYCMLTTWLARLLSSVQYQYTDYCSGSVLCYVSMTTTTLLSLLAVNRVPDVLHSASSDQRLQLHPGCDVWWCQVPGYRTRLQAASIKFQGLVAKVGESVMAFICGLLYKFRLIVCDVHLRVWSCVDIWQPPLVGISASAAPASAPPALLCMRIRPVWSLEWR